MNRELVMRELYDVMHRGFPSLSISSDEKHNVKLTSPEFGFNDIELYEFLMCIEERFSVYFEPEEIRDNGFETLDKICDLVCKKL